MINKKTLYHGLNDDDAIMIQISYKWTSKMDEFVAKVIDKLPDFLDKLYNE